MALMGALAVSAIIAPVPDYRRCCALGLALFCGAQNVPCPGASHLMVRPLDITRTVEYQEATWFDGNMHGSACWSPEPFSSG